MKEITLKEMAKIEDVNEQLSKIFKWFGPAKLNITITESEEITRTPFHLRGNIEIINKSDNPNDDRIIAGYANVTIVDDDEQFIPVETLKKGIETLLKDPHYSNLMVMHGNLQIGKIIPKHKELSTHVDENGLYIVCQLRNDLKIANELWSRILEGSFRGFSIGCEVLEDHDQCNEERCVSVLDKINIFEVSICEHPVNKESGFKIINKSKFDEIYPDNCMSECNNTKIGDSMPKKKKLSEEKQKEEPKEQPTEKAEDTECADCTEPEVTEEAKAEEPVPEPEPVSEEPQVETEQKSIEDRLNSIDAKIDELSMVIESLVPKQEGEEELPPEDVDEETPPDEYEEDVPPEEEWSKDKKSEDPEEEEPEPEPTEEKSEEAPVEETPLPEVSLDDLKKSIDNILEKLGEFTKNEDIKTELKARDDIIDSLSKKLDIITKAKREKAEPKTIQSKDETEERESDIVIRRGTVYHR